MSFANFVVADPLDWVFPFPLPIAATSTPVIPAYSATRISFQVPPENLTTTVFGPAFTLDAT